MKLPTPSRRYDQVARAQSAEATAARIVEVFLEMLMKQWFDEITLNQVAEAAGVTVQTVVRRFGGKDGLLESAVRTLADQINSSRQAPEGDASAQVGKLLMDYEKTGDAVIRLLALEPRHPALKTLLDFGRGEHRKWVTTAFAGQLSTLKEPHRARALDALVIATDVYTWKILRRDMQRSMEMTEATLVLLVQAALSAHEPQPRSA